MAFEFTSPSPKNAERMKVTRNDTEREQINQVVDNLDADIRNCLSDRLNDLDWVQYLDSDHYNQLRQDILAAINQRIKLEP